LRRLLFVLVLIAGLVLAGPAAAKDKATPLTTRLGDVSGQVEALRAAVADLDANYAREVDERDRLMLRRRFVEGRDFYYELHDYRGAAEVFYSVVNHPLASTLPNFTEAVFYLAESLFHSKDYLEAKLHYDRIIQKGLSDHYAMSLMRLMEIAVIQGQYAEAERLYGVMLSQLPEGEDGSLGRYIIGKSYARRGETAKALEIFDSIPESGAYYATAQYYAAALVVKSGNYREAVNRFRQLKKVLKEDVPNKDKLFPLTNLALARIYYEMNDFPQAMANYSAVPETAPEAPEALYESMWVFVTRNDFLLKAIEDERTNYESVLFDFAEFRDAVNSQEDQDSLAAVAKETEALQGELDTMRGLFKEIDGSLVRLQQEAITNFNKLVQTAPNNPLVPEAEILAGNIYSQAEDFQTAEEWFNKLKQKYEDFYASVAAARQRMQPQDSVDVVMAASASLVDGAPIPPSRLNGLPEETAYWLAADKDVRAIFAVYEAVSRERESVAKMRELVSEIEARLRELETSREYPILREAHRRSQQYKADIQTLQVDVLNLRNEAGQAPDEATRNEVLSRAGSMEATLLDLQSRLTALDAKIEVKKQERLAYFRQEMLTLRAPIDDFDRVVSGLASRTGGALATVAYAEMADVERLVAEYAQKADLGIIDVAWRATRGSTREIKKIQQEMEKELRELRKSQPDSEPPPEEQPSAPSGEEPPPVPPGGGGQ
jgi:tetratricopeptide (TPR) repeat protein